MRASFKKERIYRILLLKDSVSFPDIVSACDVSKAYVSKVLGELAKKGMITRGEKIYASPKALIREWGALKREMLSGLSPLKADILIPETLKNSLDDYAASGPFAESLVQGETPGKPIMIYVAEKDFTAVRNKIIKNFPIGRGQAWIYPYDEYVLTGRSALRGWKIASIPQICADLIALGTYADAGFTLFERWLDAGRRL